ncbi:MAG: cell wall-binding repeat-containing protein, partial [Coriobacteriia bacterium]|nr:cell wall-binding repeat-containing protein [Coriobacteriia bacterium]
SVPNARVNEIKAAAQSASGNTVTVDRILATGGRYDLAAAIARRIKQVHGTPPVVLVANGADPAKFFDALALSPIAASQGYPVLLVSADRVPPATSAVIAEFGSPRVIVGGGPNTVTEAVRKSVGATAQDRWYGQNRYSTATTIAQKAVGEYFCTYQWVGVAAKLPDALTGGSAVGYRGGVLVITDGTTLSSPTAAFLEAHDVDIRICLIFGGENSLSEGVRAAIDQKLLLP